MLINKELLSLILDKNVKGFYVDKANNNLMYGDKGMNKCTTMEYLLNLDTLGRLCKEWCFEQGVEVVTYKRAYRTYRALPKGLKGVQTPEITDSTELETIIKACTWVAEQKELLDG